MFGLLPNARFFVSVAVATNSLRAPEFAEILRGELSHEFFQSECVRSGADDSNRVDREPSSVIVFADRVQQHLRLHDFTGARLTIGQQVDRFELGVEPKRGEQRVVRRGFAGWLLCTAFLK